MTLTQKLKFKYSSEVRQRRAHLGITQADLARKAGVAMSTVSFAEKGQVSIETLLKLMDTLNKIEDRK